MSTIPARPAPAPRPTESVEERFRRLADIWRAETAYVSSSSELVNHPAFQEIVGMGPAVIPLLLRELANGTGHWHRALKRITGIDPVPPTDRGDIVKAAKAWLRYRDERGLAGGPLMIPALEDGVLPEGIHDCMIDEVDAAFGRFQRSARRIRLMEKLRAFLEEARRSGIVQAVVIDGSFVTAKEEPEDIDLLIVLPADLDLANLRPATYNAISRRVIRANYRFDTFAAKEGSEELARLLAFFSQVNPDRGGEYTSRTSKGLLRVRP